MTLASGFGIIVPWRRMRQQIYYQYLKLVFEVGCQRLFLTLNAMKVVNFKMPELCVEKITHSWFKQHHHQSHLLNWPQ